MKKVGLIFGNDTEFALEVINKINNKDEKGISAEPVLLDKVFMDSKSDYAVIIDRISYYVPFFRAFLKSASLSGTIVINNPFWWSADEKFFECSIASANGIKVPKSVLLPSNEHPDFTDSQTFRNLMFPLDWESIFDYVGFPAMVKPLYPSVWKNVYRVNNQDEFFNAYNQSGKVTMILQEVIDYSDYFRCHCVDRKFVRIMKYEPKNPEDLRYVSSGELEDRKLNAKITEMVIKINESLGYDINSVEIALKDNELYAIDFFNPVPYSEPAYIGEENFDWLTQKVADMAIRKAKEYKKGKINLTWGNYLFASKIKVSKQSKKSVTAKKS